MSTKDLSGSYIFISDNAQKLHLLFKICNDKQEIEGYKVYKIVNDLKKDKKHMEVKEIMFSEQNSKNEIDSIIKNFKKI